MLHKTLINLDDDGLIRKRFHQDNPNRPDYTLTERGRSLLIILHQLRDWVNENQHAILADRKENNARREKYDSMQHVAQIVRRRMDSQKVVHFFLSKPHSLLESIFITLYFYSLLERTKSLAPNHIFCPAFSNKKIIKNIINIFIFI